MPTRGRLPMMPLAELDALRHRLDQAYDRWFDGAGGAWTPAIDVERGEKDLTVRADVPGVEPEDINIEVQDGVLTISGEQEHREETKEKNYLRRERAPWLLLALDDPAGRRRSLEDQGEDEGRCRRAQDPLPATNREPVTIEPTPA